MISNRWIEQRKENWSRLELLAQQAETSGLKHFSTTELRDFGLLYRQAAADLSAVRTDAGARTLEGYLNRLVSRAHNFVYSGRRLSPRSVGRFMLYEYPRIFRRLLPYTSAALFIFLAGAGLGILLAFVRPEFINGMLGPEMMDKINHHKMWTDSILGSEPQESSRIMTNNISVCFFTFIAGVTACLGTIYFMFFNGFLIGVIATACGQHGMALSLWSFVASHGALELPSIFLSGGAGLRLGSGILFPGFLKRRDALTLAGSEAIRLLAGIVPLLIIAGFLEGFLSPSHAPLALKFSVSLILFTTLILWLSEAWRPRPLLQPA